MVPLPVLSFLHFGSVPVKAQSNTGSGIQQWCLYRYLHFVTLVQYQHLHGSLLELALKKSSTDKGNLRAFVLYQQQYHYWKITTLKLLTAI
jgi:hypothetical protein